ncbi:hypothetical protein TRAPUB_13370 [Trametes pubescens]|uniref:Uncharacterized protein n=1 Tax=Trametes pubescens TaxID=154538 RepID=A0A1M2W7Y5_TRAPU|nr:hypothetical protein TRAPUB_13370 [Trametes pubescens]
MGCIPSKQKALDGDSSTVILSGAQEKSQKKQKKQSQRLPSPVIDEDAAPWLQTRAILTTHKDGTIIITERQQSQ